MALIRSADVFEMNSYAGKRFFEVRRAFGAAIADDVVVKDAEKFIRYHLELVESAEHYAGQLVDDLRTWYRRNGDSRGQVGISVKLPEPPQSVDVSYQFLERFMVPGIQAYVSEIASPDEGAIVTVLWPDLDDEELSEPRKPLISLVVVVQSFQSAKPARKWWQRSTV